MSYIFGTAIFSLLSVAFGLHSILSSRYLNKTNLFFLILPLIISVIFILENPNTEFAFQTYLVFISMVFPAIVIGLDLANSKSLAQLNNTLIFVFIVILIGAIRKFPELTAERLNYLSGTQQFSYTVSFAYLIGLNLFYNSELVIKIWYFKLANYISLILLIFIAVFAAGRGAFLVILISTAIFVFKNFKIRYLPKLLIALVPVFMVVNYLINKFGIRFLESIYRIFSYVDSTGINMDQTSNRDIFYETALNLFSENMLFGHGIFRYTIKAGAFYAHNIFLDILVQGGIILIILFLLLMYFFFRKLNKILIYDSSSNFILIFIIYSFTFLLFSNIYLQDPFFWFSLAYVFGYSLSPDLMHSDISRSSRKIID